jgi:heat shock protein HslJ
MTTASSHKLCRTILAAAVALIPFPAASQSGAYTARGQEPGWMLTIGERTIVLTTQDGGRFEAARPPAQQTPEGERFDVTLGGKPVQIGIARRLCRDTMSGMPHPDSVTISGLNGPLKGCGGAPRAMLGPGEWAIAEIGGASVLASTKPTLAFEGDTVFGNGSCNRFRGGFTLTGEGLTMRQLASTMMACPEPVMQQEQALIRQLEATQRFDIRDDGALVLHDNAGRTLVAVKKGN